MRRALATAAILVLGSCLAPGTVELLDMNNPPPEYGRPGWVRTSAKAGSWIGGVAGGIASIALLPITWPITQLASDQFTEHTEKEFLLFPTLSAASAGHFLLGAPTDFLDFVFRRAWTEETTPVNAYELVPMEPPMGPDWRLPEQGTEGLPKPGEPAQKPGGTDPDKQLP